MNKFAAVFMAAFLLAGCKSIFSPTLSADQLAKVDKELSEAKRSFACDQANRSGARSFKVSAVDTGETKKQAAAMSAYWTELCEGLKSNTSE